MSLIQLFSHINFNYALLQLIIFSIQLPLPNFLFVQRKIMLYSLRITLFVVHLLSPCQANSFHFASFQPPPVSYCLRYFLETNYVVHACIWKLKAVVGFFIFVPLDLYSS